MHQLSPSCVISPILSSTLEDLKAAMAWTMGSHIFSLMSTCHHVIKVIIIYICSPPWRISSPRIPRTYTPDSLAEADSGTPHKQSISQRWCSFQPHFLKKIWKIKNQCDIISDNIILFHYDHTRCVPASEAVAVKEPFVPESLSPGVQVQQRGHVVSGDGAPSLDTNTGPALKCGACNK